MRQTTLVFQTLIATILLMGAFVSSTTMAADKQNVIIQVSDDDAQKWNLALNNAKNIQKDLGKDNVNIEVVAYGPGINMLKFDSEVNNRLEEGMKEGIEFRACANTMKAKKLTEKDIFSGIKTVPSGVVEIIKRQQQGWAYLRP